MDNPRVLLLAAVIIAVEMGIAAVVVELTALELSAFTNMLLGGGMGVVGIAIAVLLVDRYDLFQ